MMPFLTYRDVMESRLHNSYEVLGIITISLNTQTESLVLRLRKKIALVLLTGDGKPIH